MGRKRRKVKQTSVPPDRARGVVQEPSSAAAASGDLLSSLPDDVVLSIVRHLPVREVVRMSVLSRRWRCLPSLLPVLDSLDLVYPGPLKEEEEEEYDWFEEVDEAMSGHWGLVLRCTFDWPLLMPKDDRWAKAIGHTGVREFELRGGFCYPPRFDAYPVLQHCKSLTKLCLMDCILTGETAAGHLGLQCTELRDLELNGVRFSDDMFEEVISACPRLERLVIMDYHGLGRLRITAAPCLVYLELGVIYECSEPKCDTMDIDAPKLKELSIHVVPWWYKEITIHTPKLTSLYMHIVDDFYGDVPVLQVCRVIDDGLRRLISNATNLLSLVLYASPMECMSQSLVAECFHPSVRYLRRLCMEVSLQDNQQASCLAALLYHCNRLQELQLLMVKRGYIPNDVPSVPPILLFSEHQKVLKQMGCLGRHLQKVSMAGLTGDVYEMKLASFFLMEAGALKELGLFFTKSAAKAMDIATKHLQELRGGFSKEKLVIRVRDDPHWYKDF